MHEDNTHDNPSKRRTFYGVILLLALGALMAYIFLLSSNDQSASDPNINNGRLQEYDTEGTSNTPNPNGQSPAPDPAGATESSSGDPKVDQ